MTSCTVQNLVICVTWLWQLLVVLYRLPWSCLWFNLIRQATIVLTAKNVWEARIDTMLPISFIFLKNAVIFMSVLLMTRSVKFCNHILQIYPAPNKAKLWELDYSQIYAWSNPNQKSSDSFPSEDAKVSFPFYLNVQSALRFIFKSRSKRSMSQFYGVCVKYNFKFLLYILVLNKL